MTTATAEKVETAKKPLKLSGELYEFKIGDNEPRKYFIMTLPFEKTLGFFHVFTFNAVNGQGEQRTQSASHVNKLKREMLAGTFTPTILNAAMTKTHMEHFKEKDGNFSLEVYDTHPLHWVDGGHRTLSLLELYEDENFHEQVAKLPVSIIVYVNGDPKEDFINLQSGRNIDKAHLTSLEVKIGSYSDELNPVMKLGYKVSQIMAKKGSGSHLENLVKFDSRAQSSSLIPVNVFLAKGGSELATSIVGGAKVAKQFEQSDEWLAGIYAKCYKTLQDDAPQALDDGKLLCPPPRGNKGSASLLIGVGNLLAYRTGARGNKEPTDEDLDRMVECAKTVFDKNIPRGGIAAGVKRQLMGDFTKVFLSDLITGSHIKLPSVLGIPKPLIELWSASTFDLRKDDVKAAIAKEEAAPAEQPKTEANGRAPKKKAAKKTAKKHPGRITVTSGR